MAKSRRKSSTSGQTNIFIGLFFALLALVGFLLLSYKFFNTTTYYVLNQDVSARTQITTDMLKPVIVSQGGQPPTAWSKEALSTTPMYAKADLMAGEPVTQSDVGALEAVNKNIPPNFTVASISITPVNANLGSIHAGDKIDIYQRVQTAEGVKAYLVLQNVKVLNAGSSVETAVSKSDSKDGSAAGKTTVNTVYQLAVDRRNAANLAVLANNSSNLYVTLTPNKYLNGDNGSGELAKKSVSNIPVTNGDNSGSGDFESWIAPDASAGADPMPVAKKANGKAGADATNATEGDKAKADSATANSGEEADSDDSDDADMDDSSDDSADSSSDSSAETPTDGASAEAGE